MLFAKLLTTHDNLAPFFFYPALFVCGRNKYKKVPPEGNIVLLVGCAVGVGIKKKLVLVH